MPIFVKTRLVSRMRSSSNSPPSLISTPRPAILVAIVMAPKAPALAMIIPSSSCLRAFNTCGFIPLSTTSINRSTFDSLNPNSSIRSDRLSGSSTFSDTPNCFAIGRKSPALISWMGLLNGINSLSGDSKTSILFCFIHARRSIKICTSRRKGSCFSRLAKYSECSTEAVPTNCGRPIT